MMKMGFRAAVLMTFAALLIPITASAKGNFSYVTIRSAGVDIRTSDPALTSDFFAFADFANAQTNVPLTKVGTGYEVIRYYSVNGKNIAFDRLHYYPETGYVYYDGLINGSSEYDEKWSIANPNIKALFENALNPQRQFVAPLIAIAVLALLFVIAFLLRPSSMH